MVSKAERVREYIASHPGAHPKAIAKALEKHGVTVHDVYNTRGRIETNGHSVNGIATSEPVKQQPQPINWNQVKGCLNLARQLVTACGGINEAKECLDMTA